jgi:hypothetical protein
VGKRGSFNYYIWTTGIDQDSPRKTEHIVTLVLKVKNTLQNCQPPAILEVENGGKCERMIHESIP